MTHPAYERLRTVTPTAAVVLADNPSPMTLEGTNTWLLRAPGHDDAIVVDPGPLDDAHLDAVVAAAGRVAVVLLTHGHFDHSDGAARLAERTGAKVRALDPAHQLGDEGIGEGDVIAAAGLEVRVWATPGHTADSLSFLLEADGDTEGSVAAVLTGDTILGRGTTVVAYPDGDLRHYLQSLRRLQELGPATVLPGHGPELAAAGDAAAYYLGHREQRLGQVRAALAEFGIDPSQTTDDDARRIVEHVYVDVDPVLWPAADLSVRAQLAFLRTTL